MKYDCIIIGAGISGITAAIYLKRANKNILLLESDIPGGQINKTSNIQNYPGFLKIDGPSLAMNLLDQIELNEINLKYEKVIEINKEQLFEIKTNKNKYYSSNVILATGKKENSLGIEKDLIGKGVSYCALCDGALYKNKNVIVVGGGNSALEESLYLSNICSNVTIINRSDKLKASEILKTEVLKRKNINILYNANVKKINIENDKIVSVDLEEKNIKCEGIFIYIGGKPNLDFLNINVLKNNEYIIVNEYMQTNIPNLYAVGDIIKKNTYQIITAASEGAIAANSIIKNME